MEVNYKAGDVVCANYGKFDGSTGVGVFLVMYNERSDRQYSNNKNNLICCKITTNNLLGDSYTVRIRQGEANMNEESLVNISKLHVLANDQVFKYIGSLSGNKMIMIFKEYNRFNSELERQLLENI